MPNSNPNILVIWGDDIGITNLSCYSDGMMGYRTPNIDCLSLIAVGTFAVFLALREYRLSSIL
ncbi:MAG: hypothetical protein JO235_12530 [Chroococcidiopsidaceae cyanobacterium CP_BM_RX_35]|nr:hypothetical protein [Chroococcidiopsidaceae cyanobacterium CP_BM_RX_35]